MTADVRNIGIFAHVDAGKTTLSERMLVRCGVIRSAGAVDAGTAHTDRLAVERRRRISVKTACAPLCWRNTDIHLVDTPVTSISPEKSSAAYGQSTGRF